MRKNTLDQAVSYFDSDYNCCQSILLAYGTQFGISDETAAHLGTGFGGGMARCGEVCGAVTAAIMVIGLKHGMANEGDDKARNRTYELVHEFMNKFKASNGSVRCGDLLGLDISTPEGRQAAKEKGLFKTLCPGLVKSAAEILDPLIV